MSDQKDSKLKALKLTLDKLDKTYGKGSVMRLGDQTVEKIESISSIPSFNRSFINTGRIIRY